MRKAIMVLGLIGLSACSSIPRTGHEETDKVIVHMSKPKSIIGKDWDQKFQKDGLIGGEFIAIGSVTSQINTHEGNMKTMAEADATSRLLTSAPTEFKKIVLRTINSFDGTNGSVEQSHVSVTEVKALTGLKTNFDDVQCVSYAVPNTDLKYDFSKECRVIMRVPASELMKAYKYTLSSKYGIKEQSQINEALKEQLLGGSNQPQRETASEQEQTELPKSAKAYLKQ